MRILATAAFAALVASPLMADETSGLVQSWTPKTHTLVLNDKTVWTLPADLMIPADLGIGDRIVLDYETAGEDGLVKIEALLRIAPALPAGSDGGA
ncbi:hypothetical protein [Antarctobacter jejuensis]|uniref:hypothetical protein n=1 Tax=Antarctobacter jejuensis TaxID=1439938 RepID=UPI003FD04103